MSSRDRSCCRCWTALNASFTIVDNQLRIAASLDFETQPSLNIRVRSTDQGGSSTDQVLAITVTNVNEAPSAITLSSSVVLEGQPIGTVVGTLTTTDADVGDIRLADPNRGGDLLPASLAFGKQWLAGSASVAPNGPNNVELTVEAAPDGPAPIIESHGINSC